MSDAQDHAPIRIRAVRSSIAPKLAAPDSHLAGSLDQQHSTA
ncbi:hypothetical protein [Kitasatospora griseola]